MEIASAPILVREFDSELASSPVHLAPFNARGINREESAKRERPLAE